MRSLTLAISLLISCAVSQGCGEPDPKLPSPIVVAQKIVEARSQRDISAISQHITEDSRQNLSELLLAMDEFRVQAIRLRTSVATHIGGGLSATFDLSHLTDHLALFSEQVQLLDETIGGKEATVSYMLAGRLPTKRADFIREQGHWRYHPGDLRGTNFAPAFRELARGLERVTAAIEAGDFDSTQTRENPQRLMDEFRRRLEPGLQLLPKPQ